jgi:antibiotic biosynthesis monooxygenase
MESSVSTGAARRRNSGSAVIDAVQLDYVVTPFRAQRFYELYRPAIPRPLTYGASGYLFYRSEDDSDHFVHMSFWDDRAGFERWWFSREMQEIRVAVAGLHGQPLLPHWHTVIERS